MYDGFFSILPNLFVEVGKLIDFCELGWVVLCFGIFDIHGIILP